MKRAGFLVTVIHRRSWLSVIAGALLVLGAAASRADEGVKDFHIEAQSATTGIPEFARQAGIQILVSERLVHGKSTSAVMGSMSIEKALERLLQGTGLTAASKDGRTFTLAPAGSTSRQGGATGGGTGGEARRVAETASPGVAAPSAAGLSGDVSLGEIVVTAQKREERLQDVPVPVTSLDAGTLAENNQVRLEDYYSSVPGLSFTSDVGGAANLSIRGITTGSTTNPTVGITVDGVPYGSSSALANAGINVPDIDPSDLKRIEVLRGPQGTLYGASSIGGLLQYVTASPSLSGFSGQVQVGTDTIQNATGWGYTVRASLNAPLTESIAVRGSGFFRDDPGYINDPTLHAHGVNRDKVEGGHFAGLWQITPAVSLELTSLLQNTSASGNTYTNVNPGSGQLTQDFIRGAGAYDLSVRLYTATLHAKAAGIDVTAISGYGVNQVTQYLDASSYYGIPFGYAGSAGIGFYETKKFSQELRFSSSIGEHVEWLLGGFYTHEQSPVDQHFTEATAVAATPTGLAGPLLVDYNFPSTFAELAGYADLTVHVTSRFDVQLGGRESRNRQIYDETDTGPFIPLFFGGYPSPLINPTIHTEDSAFTFLVTPRYKFSDELMVYSRVASGYRPGGPNPDAILFHFPAHYGADRTVDYEIGVKGEAFDRRLSFDGSAYLIDWRDVQLQIIDPINFFAFYTNASSARSQGLELSAQLKPREGLTISGWLAWNDATLRSAFPPTAGSYGFAGDRLPYSSRLSGNLSTEQSWPVSDGLTLVAGGAVAYVGQRYGDFVSSSLPVGTPRLVFPGYAQFNAHAGMHEGPWSANLYVNNLGDKRGVTYIDPALGQGYIYIQPRTVGLNLSKRF